jgi:glycosyltransferase involved in cell wall biosynthesis
MENHCETSDLIVFSHLRWDFVFQRPQHLMSRFAVFRRVYFFEEPIYGMTETPRIHIRETKEDVQVVVPYLPEGTSPQAKEIILSRLVNELLEEEDLQHYNIWYYTPMALPFTRHLNPQSVLYDCMDELSKFKGAPENLINLEKELLEKADLVFTGGHSLFESKKHLHHNIHPFPSSIDFEHFSLARKNMEEPQDQAAIPHPRLGFFGVIDERMDLKLLEGMATARPEWSFVILGPVVKIDPATLPKNSNIYYLGRKEYEELPLYLAGWDCALIPFALNESTQFISPTKTPEYLAAGKPVISTPIKDVVNPYGYQTLVSIADSPEGFVAYAEMILQNSRKKEWLHKVDQFLSSMSWDQTWARMAELERRLRKTGDRLHRQEIQLQENLLSGGAS